MFNTGAPTLVGSEEFDSEKVGRSTSIIFRPATNLICVAALGINYIYTAISDTSF